MNKYAYLIMVNAGNNNNKVYIMNSDGVTLTCRYGRVDDNDTIRGERTATYPASDWNSKYRSKLKKGYKDITELKSVTKNDVGVTTSSGLLQTLQNYSNGFVKSNYSVQAASVTSKQLDRATTLLSNTKTSSDIEEYLHVIPRRIKHVGTYIDSAMANLPKFLEDEIDILDAMSSQVQVQDSMKTNQQTDLQDVLGVKVEQLSNLEYFNTLTGSRILEAYKITKSATQQAYDNWKSPYVDDNNEMELYHGSGNVNWISILSKGLLIRPAGFKKTGANFGNGIYFSQEFRKSMAYIKGGNYMALYNVKLGKCVSCPNYYSYNTSIHSSADSVFGSTNEYITYDSSQNTIAYIMKVR